MAEPCCYACGSRRSETPFPPYKPRGARLLCIDCLAEWPAEQARADRCYERLTDPYREVSTRASYRAYLRHRAASPQADLVDLVVPRP